LARAWRPLPRMLVGMFHNGTCDPGWMCAHLDAHRRWGSERSSCGPVEEVSLFLHKHHLRAFLRPGMRVLELGACDGRFTKIMAEVGCRVVVVDPSALQLQLHRRRAAELAFDHAVEGRLQADIRDLSPIAAESFDAVVKFGGPLCHVCEGPPSPLGLCIQACRPGGHVILSVMSLWGAVHRYLAGLLEIPLMEDREAICPGRRSPKSWAEVQHLCLMFRADELRNLAEAAGLEVLVVSASNALSIGWGDFLIDAREDPDRLRELLRLEVETCQEDACLDMGTHVILVGRVA